MTIQEQIAQDVATITDNSGLQTQLFEYLQALKSSTNPKANRDKVLAFAGVINDDDAKEVSKVISEEFGEIDEEWH